MSLDVQQTTSSVLTQFPDNESGAKTATNSVMSPATTIFSTPAAEEIEQWIVTYLAEMLEISADEIEADVPFDTYGLDSSAAVGLTGDLEDWLNREVDPTILYDYPTVEQLAGYLSETQLEDAHDN